MQNEKIETKINCGFNYALYLKSPNLIIKDAENKGVKYNLDIANISLDDKLSKQYEFGNCLSNDLLKKIEVGSPLKSINNDNSNILQLNLEECDSYHKSENISPIMKDNKIHRINMKFDNDNENPMIEPVSPFNKSKLSFEFSKNNFPLKKFRPTEDQNILPRGKEDDLFELQCNHKNNSLRDQRTNSYNECASTKSIFYNNSSNIDKNFYFSPKLAENKLHHESEHEMSEPIFNKETNNFTAMNPQYNKYSFSENEKMKNNYYNTNQNNPNQYPSTEYNGNYNKYSKNSVQISPDIKKKKNFVEREGDWVCMRCKNKNFSFRVSCNRCKIPKRDSEEMYNLHMKNLMNVVKLNDMMQNQIFNQNYPKLVNNHNNEQFHQNFDPRLFSPNSCPIYDKNNSDLNTNSKGNAFTNNGYKIYHEY